jgi:hypothetical protein
MPDVPGPDALDSTALHQLSEDGSDAGAEATEPAASLRLGIPGGPAERCQQVNPGVAPLLGQRGCPGVALAHQMALGLLSQGTNHREFMDVGRG